MSTPAVTPQPVTLTWNRNVNGFTADAVIEERHESRVVGPEHPVEVGSTITDHIYLLPQELYLRYAWSMGSFQNKNQAVTFLRDTFQQFLDLQKNATLVSVMTGKRAYSNMAIMSIREDTTAKTENALLLDMDLKEILLATTSIIQLTNADVQAMPNRTAPTLSQGNVNLASAPNFNSTGITF